MSAFLDNSGDIILDAVLTDKGRQAMADGNFRISKFALGDDEINYSQYDKDHASGSAYYDLEILQTPIFEAVTSQNAAINYGLLSITNRNLLYMPTMKVNENFKLACKKHNGIFYLAVNSETKESLSAAGRLATANKVLLANNLSDTQILYVETGLNTTDLTANSTNRSTFIANNDLIDRTCTVQVDNRFLNGVITLDGSEVFSAGPSDKNQTIPTRLAFAGAPTTARGLNNYSNYSIPGIDNLLYAPVGTSARTEQSSITGPRGVAVGLNFSTRLDNASGTSTPTEYTKFGQTSNNLFSDGTLFDFIDTTVYVIGTNSTATTQIPIRIIRKT